MLKFIKEILKFAVFSAVIYVFSLVVFENNAPFVVFTKNLNYKIGSNGHMFSRLQEVKTTSDVDILFLGDSHAYRGFDTRIFADSGFKVFNLGSSAQTPIQTKYLLEKYLNRLNPKTVIYSVSPGAFCSDGVESTLDLISNEKTNMDLIKLAITQSHIKITNTLIYALYRDLLLREKSTYVEDKYKQQDTYIDGGFVEKDFMHFEYMKYDELSWAFNHKQIENFDEIIEILENSQSNLILVQAPITKAKLEAYLNNKEFDEMITDVGDYYNFNQFVQLDDSLHFYDANHLNIDGVKLFNTVVLDLLEEQLR